MMIGASGSTSLFIIKCRAGGAAQMAIALRSGQRDIPLGVVEMSIPILGPAAALACAAKAFGAGSRSVVVAGEPLQSEAIALAIKSLIANEATPPTVGEKTGRQVEAAQAALADHIEAKAPAFGYLAEAVRRGIGFSHGDMAPDLRRAVEIAFARGELNYLVCTAPPSDAARSAANNVFLPSNSAGMPRTQFSRPDADAWPEGPGSSFGHNNIMLVELEAGDFPPSGDQTGFGD